ncbi:MAG: hypothetical protein ACI35W_07425, partial [Anaeroplasmataceae bacterium]
AYYCSSVFVFKLYSNIKNVDVSYSEIENDIIYLDLKPLFQYSYITASNSNNLPAYWQSKININLNGSYKVIPNFVYNQGNDTITYDEISKYSISDISFEGTLGNNHDYNIGDTKYNGYADQGLFFISSEIKYYGSVVGIEKVSTEQALENTLYTMYDITKLVASDVPILGDIFSIISDYQEIVGIVDGLKQAYDDFFRNNQYYFYDIYTTENSYTKSVINRTNKFDQLSDYGVLSKNIINTLEEIELNRTVINNPYARCEYRVSRDGSDVIPSCFWGLAMFNIKSDNQIVYENAFLAKSGTIEENSNLTSITLGNEKEGYNANGFSTLLYFESKIATKYIISTTIGNEVIVYNESGVVVNCSNTVNANYNMYTFELGSDNYYVEIINKSYTNSEYTVNINLPVLEKGITKVNLGENSTCLFSYFSEYEGVKIYASNSNIGYTINSDFSSCINNDNFEYGVIYDVLEPNNYYIKIVNETNQEVSIDLIVSNVDDISENVDNTELALYSYTANENRSYEIKNVEYIYILTNDIMTTYSFDTLINSTIIYLVEGQVIYLYGTNTSSVIEVEYKYYIFIYDDNNESNYGMYEDGDVCKLYKSAVNTRKYIFVLKRILDKEYEQISSRCIVKLGYKQVLVSNAITHEFEIDEGRSIGDYSVSFVKDQIEIDMLINISYIEDTLNLTTQQGTGGSFSILFNSNGTYNYNNYVMKLVIGTKKEDYEFKNGKVEISYAKFKDDFGMDNIVKNVKISVYSKVGNNKAADCKLIYNDTDKINFVSSTEYSITLLTLIYKKRLVNGIKYYQIDTFDKFLKIRDFIEEEIEWEEDYVNSDGEEIMIIHNNIYKSFELMCNIAGGGKDYNIFDAEFRGIFNGNGYKISNFNLNYFESDIYTSDIGLFSKNYGTIKNVIFSQMTCNIQELINGKNYCIGLIAGENYGTISNITFDQITFINYKSLVGFYGLASGYNWKNLSSISVTSCNISIGKLKSNSSKTSGN